MKNKKIFSKRDIQLMLIGVLIIVVGLSLPYLNEHRLSGDDFAYHRLRIEALASSLSNGNLFSSKISSLFFNGMGYASALFYPDIFLYPFAFLRVLGFSNILCLRVAIITFTVLSGFTSYILAKYITESSLSGFVAMILYALSPYHIVNNFMRAAVGEIQGMIFIPLVILGLWNYTEEEFDKPYILILSLSGLMLSHAISFALCGIVAVIWLLVRYKKSFRKEKLLKAVFAAATFFALTAFYWIPFVEQLMSTRFYFLDSPLDWFDVTLAGNTVGFSEVFSINAIRGVGFSSYIFVFIVPIILVLCKVLKVELNYKLSAILFIAFCLLSSLMSVDDFWILLDSTLLTSIQFPWRLHTISQLFLALCISVIVAAVVENKSLKLIIMMSCVFLGFINIYSLSDYFPVIYAPIDFIDPYSVGNAEWLPANIEWSKIINSRDSIGEYQIIYDSKVENSIGEYKEDGSFSFEYINDVSAYEFDVPKVYYKGYAAKLVTENNEYDLSIKESKEGTSIVSVEEGLPCGTVYVYYKGTFLQHISLIISLLTFIALIAVFYIRFSKRKKSLIII